VVPSSCSQVTWAYFPTLPAAAPAGGVQLVDAFDLKNGNYDYTQVTFTYAGGNPSPVDICFSPGGTAWIRVPGGNFALLQAVPTFTVSNTATGLARTVFVPPNGVARLQL
jgi:type IV fimbrial biogenesis protein FimT